MINNNIIFYCPNLVTINANMTRVTSYGVGAPVSVDLSCFYYYLSHIQYTSEERDNNKLNYR